MTKIPKVFNQNKTASIVVLLPAFVDVASATLLAVIQTLLLSFPTRVQATTKNHSQKSPGCIRIFSFLFLFASRKKRQAEPRQTNH
jgi:hypothetical protein